MNEPNIRYLAGLVLRAKQNDSDAFAELYAKTYQKVYRYACHYLRDEFLAQDAVQEVYILVMKNLEKLSDPTLFIAWLNSISFHVCFDLSKKRRQNEHTSIDDTLADILEDSKPNINPETVAGKRDEESRLLAALEELPFLEHEVIVMRFFNDMKIDDIAKACDISKSTVKRYLAQGQEKLKSKLKG